MIFIRSFPKTPIVEWYKYLFYCKAQIDGNNNDIKLSLQIYKYCPMLAPWKNFLDPNPLLALWPSLVTKWEGFEKNHGGKFIFL